LAPREESAAGLRNRSRRYTARTMLARALLLLPLLTLAAPAQRRGSPPTRPTPITIGSESQIVIDGGQIRNETFPLPQVQGDWFVTANDAHVSLTLKSTSPKPPITLDVSWFGKQPNHVINADNNTDLTGDHVNFLLVMNGQEPYNTMAKPRGQDSITVTVSRMDDHDLEAHVGGMADKLRINATVRLHRDSVPFRPMTGTYGSCDNIIYDKMYGAQNRSPSECEARFDGDVRRAIRQSLDRVMSYFRTAGWLVEKEPELKPITAIARNTEKNPFRIDFAGSGAYSVVLKMNPASPQGQAWQQRYQGMMQSLKPGAESIQAFSKMAYEMKGATEVRISVVTNMLMASVGNFKGEHTVLNLPGAAYAVFSSHAQAATGGGVDNSEDRALILLGSWTPVAIVKHSDGGEEIGAKAVFDKAAPPLSVQNMWIRINANQELTQNIVRQLDLAPLQALMRK
jgi:hypothetical protein